MDLHPCSAHLPPPFHLLVKTCVVSSVRSPRLLLEYSDDAFSDADALMARVAAFLSLPAHNFSTRIAYNTESKRGAFISKVRAVRGGAVAARPRSAHDIEWRAVDAGAKQRGRA